MDGEISFTSCITCERNSHVAGSMIWNSSSTPMVERRAMTGPPDLWSSWRLRPVSYRNTYQHTVPTPMQNLSLPGDVGINSKSFQASWYRLRRVFVARLQTLRHSANYK